MITETKLQWLRDNKKHGEVMQAVRTLNPKLNVKGISESEANSIMAGNLWGKWGKSFTNELEKIIRKRQKREEKEIKKYSTIVNA